MNIPCWEKQSRPCFASDQDLPQCNTTASWKCFKCNSIFHLQSSSSKASLALSVLGKKPFSWSVDGLFRSQPVRFSYDRTKILFDRLLLSSGLILIGSALKRLNSDSKMFSFGLFQLAICLGLFIFSLTTELFRFIPVDCSFGGEGSCLGIPPSLCLEAMIKMWRHTPKKLFGIEFRIWSWIKVSFFMLLLLHRVNWTS